jgi:hypothetical protein
LPSEVPIERERRLDTEPAHQLKRDPVDERGLRGGEKGRNRELVGLPTNPGDLDRPEQTRVKLTGCFVAKSAVDESRGLDDNIIGRDQRLCVELDEEGGRGGVVLVTLAEQREERGGID